MKYGVLFIYLCRDCVDPKLILFQYSVAQKPLAQQESVLYTIGRDVPTSAKIMEILDRRSLLPLYYQLAHHLREEIYAGGLQPGSPIPSERELMRTYDLSRNTVRQALEMLAKEGLVVRDHGHGTFVSKLVHKFEYMLETFFENWDLLERAGFTPSVDFVSSEDVTPPEPVRLALRLEKGEQTTCHTMIFYADGHPAMFTMDYLPGVFPEKYDLSTSGEGFMRFLDRISGIQVEYVLVDISAEEALGIIAETFGCPPGTPVMLYREVFLDATQSKPIAFSMNYFNRDVISFRLLTRRGSE